MHKSNNNLNRNDYEEFFEEDIDIGQPISSSSPEEIKRLRVRKRNHISPDSYSLYLY